MDLSGAAAPSARVGMSLTRLGWGEHARLVLYGGYEEGGFASSALYFFDPLAMCWLDEAAAGTTLGKPPPPRAGHTANGFGRHTMLVFGGRGEAGLLDELWALQMYRSKPSAGQPPRTAYCWLQQHLADEYGNQAGPSARAYHATAEVEEGGNQGLMLFGGEVTTRSGHLLTSPYISLHLLASPCISPTSAGDPAQRTSPYLPASPCISPASPLHLPCISRASAGDHAQRRARHARQAARAAAGPLARQGRRAHRAGCADTSEI